MIHIQGDQSHYLTLEMSDADKLVFCMIEMLKMLSEKFLTKFDVHIEFYKSAHFLRYIKGNTDAGTMSKEEEETKFNEFLNKQSIRQSPCTLVQRYSAERNVALLKKGVEDLENGLDQAHTEIFHFKEELRSLKAECSRSWESVTNIEREIDRVLELSRMKREQRGKDGDRNRMCKMMSRIVEDGVFSSSDTYKNGSTRQVKYKSREETTTRNVRVRFLN